MFPTSSRATDVPVYPSVAIGPPHDAAKPHVVVLDAGGTLSYTAPDRISYLHYGDAVGGGVRTVLEDMIGELSAVANITLATSSDSLSDSGAVTSLNLYNISRNVDMLLASPHVAGLLVTAGTSVLEEVAYFLDLTVRSDKPVIVTGAMHQYGTFTYDGYTNLFSSVRLAACTKTTSFGTVVLMNDRVFSARDVTKVDGYRLDAFGSRAYGLLGVVNENNVRIVGAPARLARRGTPQWETPFDLGRLSPDKLAKVDIVSAYIEASRGTIAGPVEEGARGIVTAGIGAGAVSAEQAVARAIAIDKGVLFVSASRTGGEGTYDTGTRGIIGAADLLPQKARILLQLGLSFSSDHEQIRRWFASLGTADFTTIDCHDSE